MKTTQQGSASIIFIMLLTIALASSGYFLYDSYAVQEQLNTQLDKAKRKLRYTERELRETASSLSNQESELSQLNRQRTSLKNEIEDIKQQLGQTQKDKTQTQQTLKDATNALEKELINKETAYAKKAAEYQNKEIEYEKKLAHLNDFSITIKQKYQTTQQQLDSELSRIEGYNTTIETLEQRLSREQTVLDELNVKLKVLDEKNTALHSEKNRLVKQFKDGTTIIRLEDTILFSSGSATLNSHGKATLELIAETLASFPKHLISVEGHTDQQPITSTLAKKYPSNWELSSARAAFAIRHLTKQGLPPAQFQAVGFGSTRPISRDEDNANQQKNRRIEILLHPPTETLMSTPKS
jgi:chemotaxis protein MotB